MSDEEIETECDAAQALVDENQDWLDAVAEWKIAGKPRDQGAKAFEHNKRQEGDEYYCTRCNKRWDVHDDDEPDCG